MSQLLVSNEWTDSSAAVSSTAVLCKRVHHPDITPDDPLVDAANAEVFGVKDIADARLPPKNVSPLGSGCRLGCGQMVRIGLGRQ